MAKQLLEVALTSTNVLKTLNGTVRIHPRWPSKGDGNDGFLIETETGERLDALQVLQLRRDQPLTTSALAVPLEFIYDALPELVQCDVHILKAQRGLPNDYSAVALHEKKYHFWPVYADKCSPGIPPHWVLVVLQLEYEPSGRAFGRGKTRYNHLQGFTVITPDVGSEARGLENDLATELEVMLPKMGIEVDDTIRYRAWVPLR